MKRNILIAVVIAAVIIGIGAWYYFNQLRPTRIGMVLHNPKEYAGKVVSLEGEVTDRTAFFGVVKFFKLKDKSGEIIVVTKRSLPEIKTNVAVKGTVDDTFQIGDRKIMV